MDKIKEVISITNYKQTDYNEMLIESLLYWADKHSTSRTTFQKLVSSTQIRNWFFTQYQKYETEFIHFVRRHPNANKDDNKRLYARMVGKIYSIYPKSLIESLKDNSINTTFSLN